MAAYGVDVLSPAVSVRRIAVLLDQLPPWARQGGQMWSVEAELLALVVDHLAQLAWITAGGKGSRPRPLPRPRPRAERPAQAAPGPPEGKSWAGAAQQLAMIPGVVISHG